MVSKLEMIYEFVQHYKKQLVLFHMAALMRHLDFHYLFSDQEAIQKFKELVLFHHQVFALS